MQAAVGKMEAAINDLLQLSTEQAEAVAVLVGDYDSPREDFDRVFADYLEKRRPIVQRMLARQGNVRSARAATLRGGGRL